MLALVADRDAQSGLSRAEVPEPEPRRDEALVAMRASSLNRGEIRRLAMREPGTVPGWDVAGTVVKPAEDGGPPEGARVVGLLDEGAWAERVAVRIGRLAELPDEVSFSDAATLPVAGMTALRTLALGGLLLHKRVLVTGAAGGVGRLAIQLANRAGAHVTGVVGEPRRGEGLQELGANAILTGLDAEGPPFDLILESAGGESLAAALARVGPGGTVVAFGNSSGEETRFDISSFYRRGGPTMYGFMLFDEIERGLPARPDLGLLADLVAAGELRTEVSLETSWADPDEAVAALMQRRVAGKAVLLFE
ncbi:MAG: NADPH:quinone reductase [Thermoleophilaceae bacterium]|nr:NADPH:quinone reductase [Thermoleophilaceae bacterium]